MSLYKVNIYSSLFNSLKNTQNMMILLMMLDDAGLVAIRVLLKVRFPQYATRFFSN